MIPFITLPVKIVRLFTSNVSPSEMASGVCLGLFMGLIPLNGPMALLLIICLFLFKINRLTAILILPFFKIIYVIGIYHLTDLIGSFLLIDVEMLTPFWVFVTHFPILALLDLNNTLVLGGLVLSALLTPLCFFVSKKGVIMLRERYFEKIKNSKLTKWFLHIPLIGKVVGFLAKVKE